MAALRVRALGVLHQLGAYLARELLDQRVAGQHVREGEPHVGEVPEGAEDAPKDAEEMSRLARKEKFGNNATIS